MFQAQALGVEVPRMVKRSFTIASTILYTWFFPKGPSTPPKKV